MVFPAISVSMIEQYAIFGSKIQINLPPHPSQYNIKSSINATDVLFLINHVPACSGFAYNSSLNLQNLKNLLILRILNIPAGSSKNNLFPHQHDPFPRYFMAFLPHNERTEVFDDSPKFKSSLCLKIKCKKKAFDKANTSILVLCKVLYRFLHKSYLNFQRTFYAMQASKAKRQIFSNQSPPPKGSAIAVQGVAWQIVDFWRCRMLPNWKAMGLFNSWFLRPILNQLLTHNIYITSQERQWESRSLR